MRLLHFLHDFLWGAPMLFLILGTGIYLSALTRFAQVRFFPKAMAAFCRHFRFRKKTCGSVSPFQAMCTALAATVGTGNLVGVAGAICLGGPGAVFWMWICAFFGMVTKFAEVTLAVHFRAEKDGAYLGGPMYVISRGMDSKWHFLATVYCLTGLLASFGVGNATQINAVVDSINSLLSGFGLAPEYRRNLAMGLILAVLVGSMLLGGAGRIGRAAERLVPIASLGYIFLCLGVLVLRLSFLPDAFRAIFQGAFSPRAITGGTIGSMIAAVRVGCARGVFTNEAGMGTAAIAHGSADASSPAQQGLLGIVEVFLDTIVMCTLTALAILVSMDDIPYGSDSGGELTMAAFASVYGSWAGVFLTAALCCFAFATVLGWGLYGLRCGEYLFGKKAWDFLALIQTIAVIPAAILSPHTLWQIAEILNGLMAIPNLIALAALAKVLRRLTIDIEKSDGKSVSGGNHADFHQCQPVRALSHAEIPSAGCGSQKNGKKDLPSEHWSAGSSHTPGLL